MEVTTTIVVAVIGSGLFNVILSHTFSVLEKRRDRKNGIEASLRLMMKDRLRFLCMHYIEQGWIYEDELEDITAMHSCYHNTLKGNGFLDKQMERVNALPVRGVGVK